MLSRHQYWEPVREMSSHTILQGKFIQSSHPTKPLWTDPGLNSGISVCKLISRKKKKLQTGNDSSNLPKKSLHVTKKSPPGHFPETKGGEGGEEDHSLN